MYPKLKFLKATQNIILNLMKDLNHLCGTTKWTARNDLCTIDALPINTHRIIVELFFNSHIIKKCLSRFFHGVNRHY